MLTISEFTAAADRHDRRVKWAMSPYLVLCVCGLLVSFGGPIARLFPPWINTPNLIVAFVLVALALVWPLHALARRDSRLVCPHCNKGLFRSRFQVVATRKCPRCDRVVIVDSEPSLPPRLSQEKVENRAAVQRRTMWHMARGVFLWLPAGLALLTGIGFGMEALQDVGVVSKLFTECVAVVLLIGLFAGWGWLAWLMFAVLPRKSNLIKCPRCQSHQYPDFVQQFGHCGRCGQRLTVSPGPDEVAAEHVPSNVPPGSPLPGE